MSYKFTTGSVRRGDVYFEDDRDGDPTYVDFGQDTITLRPSGSQILYAQADAVGINTTSPAEKLHVAGNLKVAGDDVRVKIDGDTDSHPGVELYENGTRKWIVFNDYTNDNLTFKTNSNIRMSIKQDGTVGIGIENPNHALTVVGDISASIHISASSFYGDGSNLTGISGGGSPAGSDSQIQYNNGGSFGGASGLVYDDSNARVGIGIAAPDSTLHVHADSINNGAVTISQADNSSDASQLDLSKARGSGASPAAVQNSDFIGQVRFLAYDGDSYDNFADIYAQAAGTISTTSHPTKVIIRTTQASATSPTTAVTVDENQNMTVNGNIYGKMLHMTHHRYNDGSGTGKEYIPWAGTSEQNSPSWITQGVAPYEGKLLKVLIRSSKSGGMGSTVVGIHTNVDGNTVINSTAEETETVNITTANTTYTFTFSNATHFGPGDIIGVSIDPTNAHGNVNVTCVWEYDITQ